MIKIFGQKRNFDDEIDIRRFSKREWFLAAD
jgi:hypothetical protein